MIDVLQNIWLHFQKTVFIALGLFLFVLGLITFPLPIPIGLPLIVISLFILLRYSEWARYIFRSLKKWSAHHSKPRVIYHFLKKLERMVCSQKDKIMTKVSKKIPS
ncbi:hypothetical protein [Candidatus Albibeggiatoa sp. nov. NOAA]|uniref:PGPGW domain-containing protein n=1 Tax=Candidatus Albibeggiatoa sp. nov. NOAA TaxID=3162724 RepID=UPI0032FC8EE7|nr:hypothetical protein [Thiotrichaceae bacterium]